MGVRSLVGLSVGLVWRCRLGFGVGGCGGLGVLEIVVGDGPLHLRRGFFLEVEVEALVPGSGAG